MQVILGYDPAGRLASIAYPNAVATAYDTRGRLDSLSHTLGTNPSFVSFGYTYNPVGNILDILDQVNPSQTRTHTYDALQRLTSGGSVANAESYDYDLVGNRTTSFLSSSHNHDDLNRLLEDDQFTYTYDNNGNLQTKTNKAIPTDVTTYTWDAQDQLIQIDRPDSTTVTYKYDGLGRRIEKNVAGTITRYVYDGEDILLEYDGSNTFTARYSHGDQVDQPLVLQKAGQGFFYYHSNHQGSITHLTDSNGTIANSYVYDSYGRQLMVAESVSQPYSYTGREYDQESGFYFYRARYFDANTGRFLSEDPIGLDGGDQNLYRYVSNRPLMLNDPFGLSPDCQEIGRGKVERFISSRRESIIQAQFSLPGLIPEGPSGTMSFDLLNPRKPPRPSQSFRTVTIEVTIGVENVFKVIKEFQDVFFECKEEKEGPCGEKEVFTFPITINQFLGQHEELVETTPFERHVTRETGVQGTF